MAPLIPYRVVLAEDNLPLRTLLRFTLMSDARLEVVGEAGDGVQSLELVRDLQPDLLVLDLSMPVMDGLEVLEALRGRSSPVIAVLTGFDDPDLEAQARDAGAAAYLTKGSAFDGLAASLVELLG